MPPTADDLLVERAHQDFEEGLAHARARIRERHGRLAGATLDGLVMGAVNVLRVREQMRDDVRFLVGLAHRAAAGESVEKLADENLARVLRLKAKMHFLAREDDPVFQEMLAMARALFVRRLPDLARMATTPEARDYDDLVRRAFPDRAEVDRIVDENVAAVAAMVEHLERHPNVLRIPQGMVPRIAETARDMVQWQAERVRRGVEEIYAAARP